MFKTKIFYDGTNIKDFAGMEEVVGFTTNTGFMKQANVSDYKAFVDEALSMVGDRPISFQVFEKNHDDIIRQAETISSWADNIWVKIPVINEDGDCNIPAIKELGERGVKVNVTTVFTKDQIAELGDELGDSPYIVSVFAGRISDAGEDPDEYIEYAVETFANKPNVEILWAGCQCAYDVVRAEKTSCHIITVPDSPLKKVGRRGKDLHEFSIETSKGFSEDARAAGLNV
mgnify:FL=1